MDTVFVVDTVVETVTILDSVLVIPVELIKDLVTETGFWSGFSWGTFATILLAIGTLISLYLNERRARFTAKAVVKQQYNERWLNLFPARSFMRKILNESYVIWKQEIKWGALNPGDRPPAKLDMLLVRAGIPDNLLQAKPDGDKYWLGLAASENKSRVHLRSFLNKVMPSDINKPPIWHDKVTGTFDERIEKFRVHRSELGSSLNAWGEGIDRPYLLEKWEDHGELLLYIVWLELALVNDLGKHWSYPKHLFEFAKEYWEMHGPRIRLLYKDDPY